MPIDFNAQPPQWLQQAGQWTDRGGLAAFQVGANLALQRGHMELQQQKLQQDAVAQQAQLEAAKQMMDFRTQEHAAWIEDIPKIKEWLQLPLEQQLQTPLTDLKSKQGMQMGLQFERAASTSAAAKSYTEGLNSYNKRLSAVVKSDPEVGADLALPPGQYPSQTRWQALSLAEERARVRSENVARQAEIDALARGDVPTTRIGSDNKVQTTFKPPGDAGKTVTPQQGEFPDGTKMYFNPKSGHFVLAKEDKQKEYSAPQLLSLAKELDSRDDPASKANAKIITDFLSNAATNQIAAPKTSPRVGPTPISGELNVDDYKKWKQQQSQ